MSIRKTKKKLKKNQIFEVFFKGHRFDLITQFDRKTFHKKEMEVSFSCSCTTLHFPYKKMGAMIVYKLEN